MAGFGVLIVSGILSAIFLFFIAVFAAAAAYIMASYVLEGFSIACMRKKAGDAHTFPAWIPFYSKYLLGKLADQRVMGAVSALLTLLSVCLCVYFYVCRELNTLWFILLLMALLAVFILDTLIAHRIYKSRAGKYGDVLTVFTVLSLGLLRPVFLFAVRNRAAESVPAPECGNCVKIPEGDVIAWPRKSCLLRHPKRMCRPLSPCGKESGTPHTEASTPTA